MTRAEHLKWAKDRAKEYLDADDPSQAIASFLSDLGKHPEVDPNMTVRQIAGGLMFGGHLSTVSQVREFIDGTN